MLRTLMNIHHLMTAFQLLHGVFVAATIMVLR
jgi:hypothetical protein